LDQKLTVLSKIQQKKLDQSELTIKTSDSELKGLLDELSVDSNDFSKDILKKHLNLIEEKKKDDLSIDINDCQLLNNLHKKLTKMLTCNWSIESIRELILHIDNSKEKLEHLLHSLDPVYEYNLKKYDCNIRGNNLFDILRLYSSKNWTKEIHDLAMFQIFKGSYDKNLQQLITEIFELNKEQKISILQNQKLITQYNNVENCYENKSIICPQFDIIKKWTTSEIKEWSKKVKTNNVSQYEKIAIIKRTVVITSQFPPRDIQLLSLLILMNSENKMGRLCQINTGEGKTTIVAMLAAIKALEGH
ncbi:unnamed protein product, partial [Didymodactylos carnosus]